MMDKKFYTTTPIYYVNDKPHIGHAYTTILADVLSRFHRSAGDATFFLTGTDEHGQKVQKAAEKNNLDCKQHCDETVVRFQELWKILGITNDRFIRTTDDYHKTVVQKVLQNLYDRDLIYRAEYTGWYCVGCERFFTEKDLVEGKCPDCGREVSEIVESNYFFRMSKYQDWLIEYIETHPDFILPKFRANETLGFLRRELEDLCISRPKSRLAWGIELPFDKDYVCYVWFDALLNYLSGVGYLQNDEEFAKWWPASCQLIGKDILTTHTVYWTTMLKAMDLPLPKTIFAHGWWLTGKTKMSKSLGNVVNPMDMIERCGVDAFRYYLMAEMSPGNDASFTEESFINRYNTDLANDLGNLASRVLKMALRNCNGTIPAPHEMLAEDNELLAAADKALEVMEKSLNTLALDAGISAVMDVVRLGNKYFEAAAPWTLAKTGNIERLETVVYTAAEAMRRVAVLLDPVMPNKMKELRDMLGMNPELPATLESLHDKKNILSGSTVLDRGGLFMRIQVEEPAAACQKPAKEKKEAKAANVVAAEELVEITDFAKIKLKTAKVLTAERVEGADKLLKLSIEVGNETRPLVAGVAQYYTPEEMVGKTIVIVANLKPAVIRGVESAGMLLAAKSGKKLSLVTVEGDIPSGANIG
ncbi:MAG: methionine--tRNA ligase [Lentisphaeria bacterium]|nr:methionine--tRNA ligase [Lentisphaeria bacterium]